MSIADVAELVRRETGIAPRSPTRPRCGPRCAAPRRNRTWRLHPRRVGSGARAGPGGTAHRRGDRPGDDLYPRPGPARHDPLARPAARGPRGGLGRRSACGAPAVRPGRSPTRWPCWRRWPSPGAPLRWTCSGPTSPGRTGHGGGRGVYRERAVRLLEPALRGRYFHQAPDGSYVIGDPSYAGWCASGRITSRARRARHRVKPASTSLPAGTCSSTSARRSFRP